VPEASSAFQRFSISAFPLFSMSVFQHFSVSVFLLSYIDPGTGSFLVQMLIAGTVGAVAYFRKAVFGIFRRNKGNEPAPEAPLPPPAPSKEIDASAIKPPTSDP
jgi:hypothetical protein